MFSVVATFAQTGMAPKNEIRTRTIDESVTIKIKTKPASTAAKSGNALWSDDFSSPENWEFNNTSSPISLDWSIETDNTISPVNALSPLVLSSWENGFAFINAAQEGDSSLQNANLTLVNPIDLSTSENVGLVFEQVTRNFATNYTVRVSNDGGETWVPFSVNESLGDNQNSNNPEIVSIDISSVAGGQSAILIQFNFQASWGWFWAIDEVTIVEIPDNDMVIGRTWLNNYFDYPTEDSGTERVNRFAYWNQPQYVTRPFNFAAEVKNNGLLLQTGVQLKVTFNDPFGNQEEIFSDPIAVEPGTTDTIRIFESIPASWVSPADEGVYMADFEVVQDAVDGLPGNNVGVSRSTRISSDDGGGAIFQNDGGAITDLPLSAQAQNTIHGNRYVFTEPTVANVSITHVEFVLMSFENAQSLPGQDININVRSGNVFMPDSGDNVLTRYFASDDISYTILEEDLSTEDTLNWISIELPSPILIEPNLIYQGEVEIPGSSQGVAFIGLSNDQEDGSSVLLNLAAPGSGWSGYLNTAAMIRFRTQSSTSIDQVSYNTGLKVVQNYPNPVRDVTTIQYQLDAPSKVRFDVFDLTGRLVHSEDLGYRSSLNVNILNFNGSHLSAGLYTYSISTEYGAASRKMIIE